MSMQHMHDTSVSSMSDDELAHILWNFHHLDMDLHDDEGAITADCLIVCGSNEDRVAVRAAQLYHEGNIQKIVFSGGKVHERFEEKYGPGVTEAEAFARIAMEHGVPAEAIITENEARNTPENMTLSAGALERLEIPHNDIIIVSAAQHERRSVATAQKQIPGAEVRVTSPIESFDSYINDEKYRTGRIRALVGHTLRLHIFGTKGDLVNQLIPQDVMEAYRELLHRGYPPLGLESIKPEMDKLGIDLEMHDLDLNLRELDEITKSGTDPSMGYEPKLPVR